MQGLSVVAKELLEDAGTLNAVELVQLLQLPKHLLKSAEFTLPICEIHLELKAGVLDERVGFVHLFLIQAALENLAQGVARGLARHAGLIHHDQQGRQHFAGFQALFAQDSQDRRKLGEAVQHIVGIDTYVERALNHVHQAHHVGFRRAGGVLHLCGEFGRLGDGLLQ
ncbi:hypothetical protein D3C86_1299090 [compost metagenome]